jgi:hypothetical protein
MLARADDGLYEVMWIDDFGVGRNDLGFLLGLALPVRVWMGTDGNGRPLPRKPLDTSGQALSKCHLARWSIRQKQYIRLPVVLFIR